MRWLRSPIRCRQCFGWSEFISSAFLLNVVCVSAFQTGSVCAYGFYMKGQFIRYANNEILALDMHRFTYASQARSIDDWKFIFFWMCFISFIWLFSLYTSTFWWMHCMNFNNSQTHFVFVLWLQTINTVDFIKFDCYIVHLLQEKTANSFLSFSQTVWYEMSAMKTVLTSF